jgi:hypothetical protein
MTLVKKSKPVPRRPLIEEVEPRILYSADANALLSQAAPLLTEQRTVDAGGEFVAQPAQEQSTAQVQQTRHEIVFVDTATADYQALVDDIKSQSGDGRQIDVVLLDGQADGIKQISSVLAAQTELSAIHLISHGTDGQVRLGGASLNFDSLVKNATQIKAWGQAFSADADLLIYGCDVAQTQDGKARIDALARLTGADVAASEDATGASTLDGDWNLEYRTGSIEAQVVITASEQAAYREIFATGSIAGSVLQDVNGDSNLADAVGRGAVTVKLYKDAGNGTPDGTDTLQTTTTTAADGSYSFTGLANATYWVVVDSKTIAPSAGFNGGFVQGDVWAEQTYGVAGAASGIGFLGSAGALFGGKNATVSDNAAALISSEHITKTVLSGGSNTVTGIDSAFSFNVVTNVQGGGSTDDDASNNRTIQGSLRQFIQNADAIAGANTMRFVPAVGANAISGPFSWWQITVSSILPAITDANTTIDGTAYSNTDGVTVRDTSAGSVGFSGSVGLGADATASTGDDVTVLAVNSPELELVEVGAGQVDAGIDIQASTVTVRNLALHGFGNDTPASGNQFLEGDIRIGQASGPDVGSSYTGIIIEDNVIGISPVSVSDPGAPNQSVTGIAVFGTSNGIIRRNLIAYTGRWGVMMTSQQAQGWTIQANEIMETGVSVTSNDAIEISNLAGTASVAGNYIYNNQGRGFDSYRGAGGNAIQNNTIANNGRGITEPTGIRLYGANSTVSQNILQSSNGAAY